MKNEYKQGQKDMLALIKDAYYKTDKEKFVLIQNFDKTHSVVNVEDIEQ